MSYWNNRVLAHEHDGEIYFQIHEVYYDDDGTPNGYSENPTSVGGDSLEEIIITLERMNKCLEQPILWTEPLFPEEYKPINR